LYYGEPPSTSTTPSTKWFDADNVVGHGLDEFSDHQSKYS
jgi:hypothetical protein